MDESMKAMEAPKKIYLTQLMLFATPTISSSDNDVEYIRTDYAEKVFIIKAERFLSEIHRVCDITDENGYRIELRELKARFEKYMKGEEV